MYHYIAVIIFGIAGGLLSVYAPESWLQKDVLQTKYRKYFISEREYVIEYRRWLKRTYLGAIIIWCLFILSIYFQFFV